MWEGSRGTWEERGAGGEGGAGEKEGQSPKYFFLEVLGLIYRTKTLLPAARVPVQPKVGGVTLPVGGRRAVDGEDGGGTWGKG